MQDNGEQPASPIQVSPGMLVQPSPIATVVSATNHPAEPKVLLRIETVVGMALYPLTSDQADELGGHLCRHAREARSGLTIVGNTGPDLASGHQNRQQRREAEREARKQHPSG